MLQQYNTLLQYSFYLFIFLAVYLLYTTTTFISTYSLAKYATLITFELVYWTAGLTHMYMDSVGDVILLLCCVKCRRKGWWTKYKIKTKETISDTEMLPNVLLNHFALISTVLLFFNPYVNRGFKTAKISPLQVFFEVVLYYIAYECVFYYGHRFLHLKGVYNMLHAKHHRTKGSVGISGFYMNTIDFYIESIIPILAGPAIVDGHIVSSMVWVALAGINSPHSHGGYQFPFLPPPDNHYIHHREYNKNYGLGIFDVVHNTQKVGL